MAVEAGWLWFWRQKRGKKIAAESICRALSEDERVTDLEDLPVEEILTALKKQYPKIKFDRKNRAGEVDIPDEQTAIEPRWSGKHFVFTFYGDAWKQMERVVELMTKFKLPCYDSGERKVYTLSKPPRFTGTPDEEALNAEWENVMLEEAAKIEALASDPREMLKRKKAFVDSGGMERAREEAVRRVNARKGV
jgi:hypothetical protein